MEYRSSQWGFPCFNIGKILHSLGKVQEAKLELSMWQINSKMEIAHDLGKLALILSGPLAFDEGKNDFD